jgi:Cu(I)/Ag(I) efflux system membrane fusion protein
MKRPWLPWTIAALFAGALVVVLFMKRGDAASETNGVSQDDSGRRVTAWIDPMYSQGPPHKYRSNHPGRAPDCGMKLVPVYADDSATPAATASAATTGSGAVSGYAGVTMPPERQQLIGVKLATAGVRTLSRSIRAVGRVGLDERRTAQVHAKFEGVVEALYVNFTGQTVRRGDPLLAIYSADLLATQNELILAERAPHSPLGTTLVESARARLRLWDMSAADIDRIARSGKPMRDVTLRSPKDGVVMTRTAVSGARVTPADTLYEIADLSRLWVMADVYESELPYVRVGSSAQVVAGGQTRNGKVAFISPIVSTQTRTASVRIELDNAGGALKPDMFADVLLDEPSGSALAVPESAVMNTGTRSIVFVARGNGRFEPHEVTTGTKVGGFYEIRSGLVAGEQVVVDANFMVDSESRLKSALAK